MKKFLSLFLFLFCTTSLMSAATPTVIFSEDFSGFTEGSEAEPGTVDISSYTSGKLKQVLPGWSGSKVYEAGGMLKINDYGNLQTAYYDMSANGGIVKITARVKIAGTSSGIVRIKLGYTTHKDFIFYDNDWHNISFVTFGGTGKTAVTVAPQFCIDGMIIDNLSAETSPDIFPVPEALQPTFANGEAFTARWTRVQNATEYLLDVYTKNGDTKDYVLKDEKVTTLDKEIQNLDATKTYYFTVRASNGTAVSDYSNEIKVVKVVYRLDSPVATNATQVTQTSFTANWEVLPRAESYLVNIYKKSKTTEAGLIDLVSDDFSKVTQGTMDEIKFGRIEEYLDDYTKNKGWYGINHAFANGMIVLSPFQDPASLQSPKLDMSNDGGNVRVKLNMAAYNFGKYKEDSVTVFIMDENDNTLDSVIQVLSADGFADYTINLTKGTANSYVCVSYKGQYKVYIEDMAVSQIVPAGYEKTELVETLPATGTHLDVTVADPMSDNVSYAYTVQGVAKTVNYYDELEDIFSDESNMIEVRLASTGIEENMTEKAVTAIKYIDLTGKTSNKPFNGVNIVVTTYSDGTTSTAKILR